ncbi:SDR family oxidoreductase [Massilia sp. 2TAF26]|uniref:SDR family oxidoreductase n=1 Tax=Massilia sp. 2TAF26 TaxID=3233012 RepID=UPI003F94D94F
MDDSDRKDGRGVQPSRRRFVGTMAAGLAAAPALAQAQPGAQAAPVAARSLTPPPYPGPPFPRQKQDWPGLAGRNAVALPGDIRDEAFCKKMVEQAVHQLGGLDILVDNAARQQSIDSILELTTMELDWHFKTNLYALFRITRAALPHLPPGASIITTASVQAYDPSPNLLAYSQTKAARVAFTKSLAKQLADKGIRVNAVAPGPVWTPLQVSGGQTQGKLEKFGDDSPMKRPAQPAELAPAYVALAAADASYTTGQVYGVAGGAGNP